MIDEIPPDYCMRGHRVPALSALHIKEVSKRVCEILRIRKTSFRGRKTEELITRFENHGINVDVIDDLDWIDATRATVDPQLAMIYVPEKLYKDLCRGRADAIRIFLHEIGHIVLAHRPRLHFSDSKPSRNEDSEWQADFFADSVLELLGMPKVEIQMEFKF